MKKRGLSTIIATILLILLSVAAVAIIAGFLIPFIKNQLERSSECINVQDRFSFDENGDNCKSPNGIIFSVRAEGIKEEAEKIAGFNLIIAGEESGKSIEIRAGNSAVVRMRNGSSIIRIPNSGEMFSYNYTDADALKYKNAELKTALNSGRVCEKVSDKITLEVC